MVKPLRPCDVELLQAVRRGEYGVSLLGAPAAPKPAKPVPASPYLDAEQAAAYLGITVAALRSRVQRGELRPLRHKRGSPRQYRFTVEILDAYMAGRKS